MTDTRPPEQLRNSTDDSDWLQALQEVEEIDSEAEDRKEAHRSEMAAIRERKKRKVKMLCTEMGIDRDVFEAMLADRAEDRAYEAKKAKRAKKIPDAKIEYFLDALGQYAWLEPVALQPDTEPMSVAEQAARERIEAIQSVTDAEAEEGQAALDQLTSEAVH